MKNSDFKVEFSDDFKNQLSDLSFYISYKLGNPIAARKVYYKIINSAYSLNLFPERHPIFKTKKSTSDVLRKYNIGKYLIIYYVDEKEKIVYVNNLLTSK